MSKRAVPKQLRLRRVTPAMNHPVVSVENGYLWIGGDYGPCAVVISGRATLLKIAVMLQRWAR